MTRILLTGASGFVGGALHERLAKFPTYDLTLALRRPMQTLGAAVTSALIEQIDGVTDWTQSLLDCEVVIHGGGKN